MNDRFEIIEKLQKSRIILNTPDLEMSNLEFDFRMLRYHGFYIYQSILDDKYYFGDCSKPIHIYEKIIIQDGTVPIEVVDTYFTFIDEYYTSRKSKLINNRCY